MSERYDRLMELLDKALPMPDEVEVPCNCTPAFRGKQLASHDPDGDGSTTGKWPYVCKGCGQRFDIYGGKSPLAP